MQRNAWIVRVLRFFICFKKSMVHKNSTYAQNSGPFSFTSNTFLGFLRPSITWQLRRIRDLPAKKVRFQHSVEAGPTHIGQTAMGLGLGQQESELHMSACLVVG